MSDRMDALIQRLGELNETVKAHQSDPATLDMDMLRGEVENIVEGMTPDRKGEIQDAEVVGPPEFRAISPIVKEGKFAGMRAGELAFVSAFLKRAHGYSPSTVKLPSPELIKALTSTGSATGDELVPTGWAAEMWQDFFTASRVVANLGKVAMPTNPFEMPLGLGDITWYKGSENTATTASDTATAKGTLTATEQVAEVNFSYHLDEDSIIAVLPGLRDRLRISGGEQMDYFALNADSTDAGTGNINLDDANPADTKPYLSDGQDGIRHLFIVDNTSQHVNAGGDALSDADIRAMLVLMGKYAVNPERCVMFPDIDTYLSGMLNLDNVQTLDKYGPQAVVITGELAKYRGVPIVLSASMKKSEADGKLSTTAGSNTLGNIACIHKDFWRVGFRRELLMEVDRDIQKRQFILVVSFRIAVAAHGTRSSATHTAGIRNILV